jgi:hypothetical protein
MVVRTYPDPADAIEAYLRFLYLAAVRPGGAVPNRAIDAVWHAHLADTRAYQTFCKSVVRRFIHHRPGDPTLPGPDAATRQRFYETLDAEREEFSRESLAPGFLDSLTRAQVVLLSAGSVVVLGIALTDPTPIPKIALMIAALISLVWILREEPNEQAVASGSTTGQRRARIDTGDSAGARSESDEIFYLCGMVRGRGSQSATTHSEIAAERSSSGDGDGGTDDGCHDSHGGDDGASCSSCGGD